MLSSISETVRSRMAANGLSGYERQAAPIIAALEAREQDLYRRLLTTGVDMGLNRGTVAEALNDAGMMAPPVHFAADNGAPLSLTDRLAKIEHDMKGIADEMQQIASELER